MCLLDIKSSPSPTGGAALNIARKTTMLGFPSVWICQKIQHGRAKAGRDPSIPNVCASLVGIAKSKETSRGRPR